MAMEVTPPIISSIVKISCPVCGFHTLIVLSSLLASIHPSPLMATLFTHSESPSRVRNSRPERVYHTLIRLSSLPLTIVCPSGLKATQLTASLCPWRVNSRDGDVYRFHALIVLSPLPLASNSSSGLKATQLTASLCPLRE